MCKAVPRTGDHSGEQLDMTSGLTENTRLRRVACPSGSQLPSQVAVESACVSSGARA